MCKIIFIGTAIELNEIPFDENKPDFHVEALTSEFMPVKDKFNNVDSFYEKRNIALGVAGVIWLYNIFDAIFSLNLRFFYETAAANSYFKDVSSPFL